MTTLTAAAARAEGRIIESENGRRGFYLAAPKPEEASAPSEEVPPIVESEDAPAATESEPVTVSAESHGTAPTAPVTASTLVESQAPPCPPPPANDPYQGMRDTLRAGGVKVTVAAQLFPTPRDLALRVVDEARLEPGHRILEPSAGTGRLIDAALSDYGSMEIVAVESNPALASALLAKYGGLVKIRHADFLECGDELGTFDRVIMNPPFALQDDIRHVRHAAKFLRPGGRLVAIVSAGASWRSDRMATEFREFVESRLGTIEPLPADSFKESGTSVNAVLVCFGSE